MSISVQRSIDRLQPRRPSGRLEDENTLPMFTAWRCIFANLFDFVSLEPAGVVTWIKEALRGSSDDEEEYVMSYIDLIRS